MKPFLVLSLSLLAALPLYGQREKAPPPPSSAALSLDFTFGAKYGQAEEIVYNTDKYGPYTDTRYSELLWDLKPLLYWGVALDYSPRNPQSKGFLVRTALQAALPGKTGIMEDRDWRGPGDILSDFSTHDNDTEGAWFLDFSAGYTLPFFSRMRLEFYGTVHYMNFHWTAREGYGQYDVANGVSPGTLKSPFFGPVIRYSQDWLLFAPGVALGLSFFRNFTAALSFEISPLIIAVAVDEHLVTKAQYTDTMFFGLFMEPRGEFVFSPHEGFDIALSCSYRFIRGPRGNTQAKQHTGSGSSIEFFNAGGAAYYVLDGGLSLTVHL
jgi:outer membrane protease